MIYVAEQYTINRPVSPFEFYGKEADLFYDPKTGDYTLECRQYNGTYSLKFGQGEAVEWLIQAIESDPNFECARDGSRRTLIHNLPEAIAETILEVEEEHWKSYRGRG